LPITIAKDAGAGSDTTLTISNFSNLSIDSDSPSDVIGDISSDSQDAVLVKFLGPQTRISFDYVIMAESSSVVSGAGRSVTTAPGQMMYLHDTLFSTGAHQINDLYTITIDFGGGESYSATGIVFKVTTNMTGDQPLTFSGHIDFLVGTVL
jgi:hypothetical protein